jgi:hypothetical protein
MDENKYLELVRKKTLTALWVLFWLPTVLSVVSNRPEDKPWQLAAMVAVDAAMVTMFVMRQNWVRAVLFAVFALTAFVGLVR